MKKLILLPILFLTSCSVTELAVSGAAAAIGAFAYNEKSKKDSSRKSESEVIKVDLTGTARGIGGQLISDNQLIHVSHWNAILPIIKLTFTGLDGRYHVRDVMSVTDLGGDLNILTLSEPLISGNHTILPIGKPQKERPVTIYRMDREPFGTYLSGFEDTIVRARSEGRVSTGDSGKIWVQNINGTPHVVSLTSTESSVGPNISSLLKGLILNDK